MSEKRTLGTTNFSVTPVGLGCMGFSHAYGAPTERSEAVKTIRLAADMGYEFFDTAECYTGENPDGSISYNEELVGEALQPIRNQVVIATKFGVKHEGFGLQMDSRPETIRASVEGSLRKLRTDCIDLYYQHRIDPKVEPETVAQVMKDLIQEGKIRAWGISEVTEDYLRRAYAVCPVAAVQNSYSMLNRVHEPLFPTLEELNVTLVAFSPLGNGFLSGRYHAGDSFSELDFRAHMPQYSEAGFQAASELLKTLDTLAQEKSATPAQISLAWMLCKKPYIIPIPGSRKENRLRENLGAAQVQLTKEELAKLDGLLENLQMPRFQGAPGPRR